MSWRRKILRNVQRAGIRMGLVPEKKDNSEVEEKKTECLHMKKSYYIDEKLR